MSYMAKSNEYKPYQMSQQKGYNFRNIAEELESRSSLRRV